MDKKKLLFIGIGIIILLAVGIFFWGGKELRKTTIQSPQEIKGLSSNVETKEDILNNITFGASFDTAHVEYLDKQIRIRITAMTGNVERNLSSIINFWKVKQNNEIKWGANLTVPNQDVADSLTELRYYIDVEGGVISKFKKKLKDGIRIYVGSETNGMITTDRYITFGFDDLLIAPDLNGVNGFDMQKIDEDSSLITFNITDVNFTAGQIVDLDPKIVIDDVNSYGSLNTNVTTSSLPTAQAEMDDDILAYWNWDVNSSGDVYDMSGNENTLTIEDQSYFDGGFIGQGMTFDGVDDELDGTANNPVSVTEFTINLWGRLDSPLTGERDCFFNGRISGGSDEIARIYMINPLHVIVDSDFGISINPDDPADPIQDEWVMYTLTVNNATQMASLYVNGSNVGNDTSFSMPIGTMNQLFVGHRYDGGEFLNGTIDELMLINRSLTVAEVEALYINQSARFKQPATQTFLPVNIQQNSSYNRVNITTNSIN